MNRVVDIDHGIVMVVTDLHGDWPLYRRYRDVFLHLREHGLLDTLVFTGDLIHSEGPPETDKSLEIVLDLIELRKVLGDCLVVLLGNHEMPHLYTIALAKGDRDYTPRFEAAMGGYQDATHRDAILTFFDSLPIYARTQAGVALCHAGAPPEACDPQAMAQVFNLSHQAVLAQAAARMPDDLRAQLRYGVGQRLDMPYDDFVRENFLITGPDDPRYDDYLISQFARSDPAFGLLWSALFVKPERAYRKGVYAHHVRALLQRLSEDYAPQSILVAGHIGCPGGYRVLAGGRQLRLASGSHAHPYDSAKYLIFDATKPVTEIEALLPGLVGVING